MRYGWVVRDYVVEGLGLAAEGESIAFVTITEGSTDRGVEVHAESVSRFLGALWRFLAQQEGKTAREARVRPWVGVREFQTRGAVHTHLLIRGWPDGWVDFERLQELRTFYGLGRTQVQVIRPGGKIDGKRDSIRDLSAYMSKTFGGYLTKSTRDQDLWRDVCDRMPARFPLLIHSRDWVPGESLESFTLRRAERVQAERDAANPRPGDPAQVARMMKRRREAAYIFARDAFVTLRLAGLDPVVLRTLDGGDDPTVTWREKARPVGRWCERCGDHRSDWLVKESRAAMPWVLCEACTWVVWEDLQDRSLSASFAPLRPGRRPRSLPVPGEQKRQLPANPRDGLSCPPGIVPEQLELGGVGGDPVR